MVDLTTDIFQALSGIDGVLGAYLVYPKNFSKLPCISFYEAHNAPKAFADDTEYLSEIVFVIDVWAKTDLEAAAIMQKVDTAMLRLNFIREFCAAMPVQSGEINHRTSKYKRIA